MNRIVHAIAFGFFFLPLSLYASPVSYSINTQTTKISLAWQAFGHLSNASMAKVTGKIILDAGNEREDRINVTIPVSTLMASNGLLTYQMKSRLFFDAENYPNIAFASSRVKALGNGHFRLFGILTVKDVARSVILDASLDRNSGEFSNADNIFLHATTAISRSAFHMDNFSALVDDTVTINIEIQARLLQGA